MSSHWPDQCATTASLWQDGSAVGRLFSSYLYTTGGHHERTTLGRHDPEHVTLELEGSD